MLQGHAKRCESREEDIKLNGYQKIALIGLSSLVIISLLATFIHYIYIPETLTSSNSSLLAKCILCFSIRQNCALILNTETSGCNLKCLNGIRFWTMSWIVLGHTLLWVHYSAFSHTHKLLDLITPFYSQAIFNVSLSVDTFFLISGLLTSYATWRTTEGISANFSTFWFLLSRYIRLTPALLCIIGATFFLPLLGNGPIWWEFTNSTVKNCENNWWINMIYMQQFIKTKDICLIPSWWLANDMHFHIISLFTIIALFRKPKYGFVLTAIIILAFTLIAAFISFTSEYLPAIPPTIPQVEEFWEDYVIKYFWKPYLHAPPFFIGLILGYFLAIKKHIKLSQWEIVSWWTIALITMMSVLKAPYTLTLGGSWSKIISVLFDCTNRIFWSLSVSWVIYACSSGYGGLIADFLGHKIFAPLAKITYMVFLTHMWLIWVYIGSLKDMQFTSRFTMIYIFLAHWLVAQIIGFVCALIFESPFLRLQKQLYYYYTKKYLAQSIVFTEQT